MPHHQDWHHQKPLYIFSTLRGMFIIVDAGGRVKFYLNPLMIPNLLYYNQRLCLIVNAYHSIQWTISKPKRGATEIQHPNNPYEVTTPLYIWDNAIITYLEPCSANNILYILFFTSLLDFLTISLYVLVLLLSWMVCPLFSSLSHCHIL